MLFTSGDKTVSGVALTAQPDLAVMFGFRMLSGNATALFGNDDPMGKTVKGEWRTCDAGIGSRVIVQCGLGCFSGDRVMEDVAARLAVFRFDGLGAALGAVPGSVQRTGSAGPSGSVVKKRL